MKRDLNWPVVHVATEPHHRGALGYKSRGALKGNPEYLVARRGKRLILNIVDANHPRFFDFGMISEALDFIEKVLEEGMKVLVHCNPGESRSPYIALLNLATRAQAISNTSLSEAEADFKEIYPDYAPRSGIRGHLAQYWDKCLEF